MIFQWSRPTGGWELLTDGGALIGRAKPIPGECWEITMEAEFGGRHAFATHLDLARDWMMAEVSGREISFAR